ncbi:hypothetical protein DY138_00500 [Apilactobacillus timberlakei]|uniref:hypothetical protein n=1 Tax=Apilactobacillus timberlakei TaxID=2008380 RepID=UPI00112BDCC3|nr:hypothetical protein [Apilactobacillus timberlakei]TPR19949.1 hypothetical protein DY138_00500 [Apilactobacillus timberlakei]TPR21667.1 hypothetical protein DY061_00415 [Apilactobacillus timberlakei]TPR22913.1 hypothetical protein DY083_02235 [Apilactobacillus timberlakei]
MSKHKYSRSITFEDNGKKIKFRKLLLNDSSLTLNTVKKVQTFIREVKGFSRIYINLNLMKLNSKLPISILEYMFYDLIVNHNKKIVLDYKVNRTIFTEGFRSSPLIYLGRGNNYNPKAFLQKFKFSSVISGRRNGQINHYRRKISSDKKTSYLSILSSDIYNTFPNFVTLKTKNEVTQLITELVGNTLEHTNSDCILDLDITSKTFVNKSEGAKKYFGININIFDYSNKLIFSEIKSKILNDLDKIEGRNKYRYSYIKSAYNCQKQLFNKNYSNELFWILATLQHKISGRSGNNNSTGGTGLTTLIDALQEASKLYNCYILTGKNILDLKQKYLKHNSEKWLGFNRENDFKKAPDESIFKKSPINFRGTAFNLNFIIEG